MTRRSPDMNGPAQESPPGDVPPLGGGPRPHQATAGGAGPPTRLALAAPTVGLMTFRALPGVSQSSDQVCTLRTNLLLDWNLQRPCRADLPHRIPGRLFLLFP
jgi:hypothetical protein